MADQLTPADVDAAIEQTITSAPSVKQAVDHAVATAIKAGDLPYFSMPTGKHRTKRVRPGVLEITVPMNTGHEITLELSSEQDPET